MGVSPLDPTGHGSPRRGAGRFWDMIIGPGNMTYRIRESYPCADECANVWTLTNRMPAERHHRRPGQHLQSQPAGKLTAMRAYWSYAEVEQKLKAVIGP